MSCRELRLLRSLHSEDGNPRLPGMRPLLIVVSTCWWSALTLFAFAYAAYATYFAFSLDQISPEVGLGLGALLGALAVSLFLACAILWFLWSYWQGQGWTRDSVMIVLAVNAAFFLREVGHIHRFAHGFEGFLVCVRTINFVFGVYVFYWLTTKEARRYFAFHPKTN